MEFLDVTGCPYEDNDGEVLNVRYRLAENETVNLDDIIKIEMMGNLFVEREIKIINPKYAGDYSYVSKKAAKKVELGEYHMSEKVMTITGPCIATFVVTNLSYHSVKTKENIEARELQEEHKNKICISPFKEIHCGQLSIYDYVKPGYSVPDKVIAYLRTTQPYMMSPGKYEHPFKKGFRLLGPYLYTDGTYYWDRDTWKYVMKYGVELPQEFIDHVMSEEGTAFIEKCIDDNISWSRETKKEKKLQGFSCYLLNEAEEKELEDF